jgi:hypothetical protein
MNSSTPEAITSAVIARKILSSPLLIIDSRSGGETAIGSAMIKGIKT